MLMMPACLGPIRQNQGTTAAHNAGLFGLVDTNQRQLLLMMLGCFGSSTRIKAADVDDPGLLWPFETKLGHLLLMNAELFGPFDTQQGQLMLMMLGISHSYNLPKFQHSTHAGFNLSL